MLHDTADHARSLIRHIVAAVKTRSGPCPAAATAQATVQLIEQSGGTVVGCTFVIDLPDLGGSARLAKLGHQVLTLCVFEGE